MLKILYLEDSEIDAKLIRRALQGDDIHAACTVVPSKQEFEAAIENFDFNLVFADYRLPGFDAMQALDLLKARKIDVPFILISGAIGEERAAEVLKAGVTDYVLKDHLARLGPAVVRALEEERKRTHQKEIEKEIQRYTHLWSDAETLGKMGAFRWTHMSDTIYCTPGMYRIFEVSPGGFITTIKNIIEKIHPEDRERVIRQANTDPRSLNSIFRIQLQDEGLKYLRTQGTFTISEDGNIESVQGIVQDVTVQYMAEEAVRLLNEELEEKVQHRTKELKDLNLSLKREVEEHKRTERLLRHSEEKYRLISDYSSDLVALHGLNGEILHASPSSEDILGYHPVEMIGMSPLILVHPDDRHKLITGLRQALISGQTFVKVEGRYLRKDGKFIWMESAIRAITNEKGEIVQAQTSSRNISAQKASEAQMRRALQQEKELSELRSRFVSIASHQFRTPLSVIRSNVELLEEIYGRSIRPDHAQKFLNIHDRIEHEIDRLIHLMDDILIMGKLNAGKVTAELELIDLEEVIKTIWEREFLQVDKDRQIILRTDGIPQPVLLDHSLFEHILVNLLTNAYKYSEGPNPPEIHTAYHHDSVSISVIDFGIGILEEELPYLFDSFYRGSNTQKIPGTGLGLSIVKEFVEINQGQIFVDSTLEEGSTFTLTFPLEKKQNYAGTLD